MNEQQLALVRKYAKEHLIGHRRTGRCRSCVFAKRAEESYFEEGRWCSIEQRNEPTECRAWNSVKNEPTSAKKKALSQATKDKMSAAQKERMRSEEGRATFEKGRQSLREKRALKRLAALTKIASIRELDKR